MYSKVIQLNIYIYIYIYILYSVYMLICYIYLSCFLRLLLAMTVSDVPCFRQSWQFWGVLARYLTDHPSVGICLIFFLMARLGSWVWEEDHVSKAPSSFYHIKGTHCQHNDRDCAHFGHLAEVVFVSFSPVKLPLPSHIVIFGRQPLSRLTLQERGVMLHPLENGVAT